MTCPKKLLTYLDSSPGPYLSGLTWAIWLILAVIYLVLVWRVEL